MIGLFAQSFKFNCIGKIILCRNLSKLAELAEVGRLLQQKEDGKYSPGQLFLHRILGYRGVVLFPWLARVFDRDAYKRHREVSELLGKSSYEEKGLMNYYYQALIDNRDCPFIRAQTEASILLGTREKSRSLYNIPGLDYVAHDEIAPYSSTEKIPLHHELFDKFLLYSPEQNPTFGPRESLKAWKKKNRYWLQLSEVHKETTEGVKVTVIPFYLGWHETAYKWRYCIRLENLSKETIHVRERHWRIFSVSGKLETVRGKGINGHEPTLSPKSPAFQYCSNVSLQCPSGHMWGNFKMERDDGYSFECRIPAFKLESRSEEEEQR